MQREILGVAPQSGARVVAARAEARGHSTVAGVGEAVQTGSRSFPIPLKKQNQVTLTFSKLPVDKDDIEKLKSWIDLMGDNLVENDAPSSPPFPLE
jgi:hypothetical protein